MSKEIRTLYQVKQQSSGKWLVLSKKLDPSYGYAFGTYIEEPKELGTFATREKALEHIFSISEFQNFVVTDLNSKGL